MAQYAYTHGHSNRLPRIIIWAVIVALLLIALLAGYYYVARKHHSPPVTASQNTKGETSNVSSQPANQNTPSGENSSGSPAGPPSATLTTPYGNFVSNHHPNLSGSPAPNTLTSVCTTTQGASCTIEFIKDGITKSLPVRSTDEGGSAYWNWKLQDIGLTAGSWQIQAKATLNGQTKIAQDSMELSVAQ